jgi:hypothetical protein
MGGDANVKLRIQHFLSPGLNPRTIHAMFALNWLTGFRREDF